MTMYHSNGEIGSRMDYLVNCAAVMYMSAGGINGRMIQGSRRSSNSAFYCEDMGLRMSGIPTGGEVVLDYNEDAPLGIFILAHELLGHAYHTACGDHAFPAEASWAKDDLPHTGSHTLVPDAEIQAILIENHVRLFFGYPCRTKYKYDLIPLGHVIPKGK